MNIQEAKAMEGTEFTFIFEDGDTVRAYVKKFDHEVGLSCYSLETETVMGYKPSRVDEDGTWCLMRRDFRFSNGTLEFTLDELQGIKETGEYDGSHGRSTSVECIFS